MLEAKKETQDPLKGMQQAKGYADCQRFEVKYVFATNGHLYGKFDFFTNLWGGPFPFIYFPPHPDLTARYAKDTGIDITKPEAAMLFQADSLAWSLTRYYQDAAIRAAFEKIIHCRQQDVRIYDYAETDQPQLNRMWDKRQRGYRAMGYEIKQTEAVF